MSEIFITGARSLAQRIDNRTPLVWPIKLRSGKLEIIFKLDGGGKAHLFLRWFVASRSASVLQALDNSCEYLIRMDRKDGIHCIFENSLLKNVTQCFE